MFRTISRTIELCVEFRMAQTSQVRPICSTSGAADLLGYQPTTQLLLLLLPPPFLDDCRRQAACEAKGLKIRRTSNLPVWQIPPPEPKLVHLGTNSVS